MVKGLDVFANYFKDYPNNYVIIGGTACDIIIDEAGFTPRTTKDIDIILVVEALSPEFVKQFWQFIKDGNYERKEQSADERKYYRFTKPADKNFPYQIELFARTPDLIHLEGDAHLTPIPVEDDLSSLSAILLSDDYYNYMIEHSVLQNGLHSAKLEALICLKAKAFLEITTRIANGSKEDAKQLRKHKADVFRLAVFLTGDQVFETPPAIKAHLKAFAEAIEADLPDEAIFKEMGVASIKAETIFAQLLKSFQLNGKQ